MSDANVRSEAAREPSRGNARHANAIVVRKMDFDFGAEASLDPVLVDGAPEESYALIGLSLLLPYLEPYLIRTMRAAKPHVADPELADDLDRFCAQEGQHYRQHRRFNEAVRMPGLERLKQLEDELESDYQRFSREKSLRFNLAYAEGFEALTTATARFSFEMRAFEGLHPAAQQLFAWHLIEELEHRTVAFDVYDHVCGSYPYRLGVGLFAQWHMGRFIGRVTRHLIEADPATLAAHGGAAGQRERVRMQRRAALRGLLPKLLPTYLPWYTPRRIAFTAEMEALARDYSERAVRIS